MGNTCDSWSRVDILRRDCAQESKRCKKPGLPERVRTNTQAVLRLAWGGLAKGNQSVQPAEASVVSQQFPAPRCNKPPGLGAQGLGPGPPGAWGPAHRGLVGLKLTPIFVVLKSLLVGGRRRLKRLPRRWGPGGKRARDTPQNPLRY